MLPRISRRLSALGLITASLALLALAPGAFAATLGVDGSGNLVYTAADGKVNAVEFDQTDTATVEVHEVLSGITYDFNPFFDIGTFTDNDPITTGTNCTNDADGTPGADTDGNGDPVFTCTGVTGQVQATASDDNDAIDASGLFTDLGGDGLTTIPLIADLGTGDDSSIGGGAGNDSLWGECNGGCGVGPATGNDTLTGGDGNDDLHGEQGNDTLNAGAGDDFATGGQGNDSVDGGDGDDFVQGASGDDTVNGGNGDDFVTGGCGGYENCGSGTDGNDTVNGGGGQDRLDGDGGTDTMDGGSGIDVVSYEDAFGATLHPVNVTLDGQANDGGAGEGDNVLNVEDVQVQGCCGEPGSTLTGDAGVNALSGAGGNDTITGGDGNDFLFGNEGDDTINANDGFADRVVCGSGNDIANVDEFDQVADDCETVNRTTRGGLATEDAPPTVTWVSPASGATMSTSKTNTLQVNATDDHGIAQVIFMNGERVLCTDTTAPYTCDYKPIGDDVGKDTLSAIAVDTRQQTATALRSVKVGRFAPRKLSAKTSPRTDTSVPFTFRTKGTLSLPSGVTKAAGCKGKVTVTFKAGKKTISTRRATLKKSCAYSSKVTFTLPRRLHPSRLKVVVRFGGNAVLAAKSAKRYSVKTA